MKTFLTFILCIALGPEAAAQEETPAVEVTHLSGPVYMLTGRGGTLAMSVSDDSVALVDVQYEQMTTAILTAVREISSAPIAYVINTHWHGDHTGGNENIAGEGAIIVAHERVRTRMSSDQFMEFGQMAVPASADSALPVITFDNSVTLQVNGESVMVRHAAFAHTDGDAIVYFTKSNVLHMGDAFWNGVYPRIDVDTGANVYGMMDAVRMGLQMCREGTHVIAGHSGVSDCAGLQEYLEMLQVTSSRVEKLAAEGLDLEAIIERAPNADYDERWGQWYIKPADYLMFLFRSLDSRPAP